ncbi:hypothetical protein SAZ10_13460 [Mesorhizobium sp. BAC0120]|uniref:hypothetical protein n=1 Tax=Mesorhizobium sp. BAC0120 TaxID=3090670 RepID=UPI00298C482B|nr:hypothetical protein [Mesorhizobium sp. BAC0120]MDW6022765.1 hypothetical protein [Mesorhizobium sp. BAC0120]
MKLLFLRAGVAAACASAVILLFLFTTGAECGDLQTGIAYAGIYALSDELGGFKLISAAGTGTRSDPLSVTVELESASPVTLTIRSLVPVRLIPGDAMQSIYFRVSALNNSALAWIEFEFELQSRRGEPSDFGDGLSFDQTQSAGPEAISSDGFAKFTREFEPYDRLRFHHGKVDPLETVSFSFLVTDFMPKHVFYLVLDPRIPSS